MQLSQEDIEEFKAIYRKDYGTTLTDGEALDLATSFFHLMLAIYRPLPDESCDPGASTVRLRR